MDLTHARRMLRHNHWANREVLEGLKQEPGDLSEPARLLAHIVAAEHLWLGRIAPSAPTLPVWPRWTLEECATRLAALPSRWDSVLASLETPGTSGRDVAYTNSKGEAWRNRVDDIVLHVVLHGSYHRGQIAVRVRESGGEPAYTDFIHAVRRGRLA